MIFQSKNKEYEKLPSTNQDLTFDYLTNKFNERKLNFNLYGLALLNFNNIYNNAALFLSDQNSTITKFAIFQGTTVKSFLDKKEFTGSIVKQLDDVLYYINLVNRKKIIITGKGQRDEYFDYPARALREAIVNCYCHRDWSLTGDIKIEVYDDKIKIYSPGSLPEGLTLENIKKGISAKRNPVIINVLDKGKYIENYSTGV